MAHQQQIDFMQSVKDRFPIFFEEKMVLDIGSLDINGNNAFLFGNCLYLGVDLFPGPNVDLLSKGHELCFPDASFDVIISSECFEHDRYYDLTLKNMIRMLSPGGLFLFSCATTGRNEHGTRRSTPEDAPFLQAFGDWGDYYRNLEEADIRAALDIDGIFHSYEFSIGHETYDLYFWGIKRGELPHRIDRSFQLTSNRQKKRIIHLEDTTISLNSELARREEHISTLHETIARQSQTMADLYETAIHREQTIDRLHKALSKKEGELADLHHTINERASFLDSILKSRSWRLTRPLRSFGQLARKLKRRGFGVVNPHGIILLLVRLRNACRYLLRGDISGLANRYRSYRLDGSIEAIQSSVCQPPASKTWGIMTTSHTLFVARLIANRLQHHGWNVEILTEVRSAFPLDWYVVICPQMFKNLPPAEKRIPFQMEQSVSSRWFTDHYFKILENSLCMFDYALKNIEYLEPKGIAFPHVYYLPVGAIPGYAEGEGLSTMAKTCDVLFYGDCKSSPRRRQLLDELAKHFDVRIASEIFGREMKETIRSARVVINLHYYDDALLEMPRIQECLSLGVPVVSETAQDQDDYPELSGAVTFFAEGSVPGMIDAVKKTLNQPPNRQTLEQSVALSARRFAFMFDRFLIAVGFLPTSAVSRMELSLPEPIDRIVLSLPETTGRRKMFIADHPQRCVIFDGIRRRPGWVGCGLSYKSLAHYAERTGRDRLTVMEDDVIFPTDYDDKIKIVERYLEKINGEWDVFAGVIASLHPEAKVLSVDVFDGITFVTINKMTSTVFNIYEKKVLKLFTEWDPDNLDAERNTIDRFLESQTNLRVVVTLPFLVGHREEVHSTLWGFQNTQYRDMIEQSEKLLSEKVFDIKDALNF